MAVCLFVGNLPYDMTEVELRAHFAAVGPLASLSLSTDRDTGRPRGVAFIEFSDRADAEGAMRRLNPLAFKGRPLAVSEACARDDRSPPRRPRPVAFRPSFAAEPRAGDHWNCGPDKAPRRQRKPSKGATQAERSPRRPMHTRDTGPVRFGTQDDDGEEEVSHEHFASRREEALDQDLE